MVQAWKRTSCGEVATDPKEAGDHERQHHESLVGPGSFDPAPSPIDGKIHFMEDLGE